MTFSEGSCSNISSCAHLLMCCTAWDHFYCNRIWFQLLFYNFKHGHVFLILSSFNSQNPPLFLFLIKKPGERALTIWCLLPGSDDNGKKTQQHSAIKSNHQEPAKRRPAINKATSILKSCCVLEITLYCITPCVVFASSHNHRESFAFCLCCGAPPSTAFLLIFSTTFHRQLSFIKSWLLSFWRRQYYYYDAFNCPMGSPL